METTKPTIQRFTRNHILICVAVLVTLYGLFVAPTFPLSVYSIGVLVLFIPFLEIRNQSVVLQLFFVFFICIQISSIALFDRLPYELLLGSQPFGPAFIHALPAALLCCAAANILLLKHVNIVKLYTVQFPIMLIACTWYIRMVLILNNCQHTPDAKNVQITAVVVQKCPVCCDIHELLLSFSYEGRQYQLPMDVHPKLYEKAKEGDKLNLRLHPGVYGWPWYHKDIKRRYK